MKIVCGSCQAKYSIADEKVAGKVFKIRCKRCSEVIVVRGDQESAPQAAAEPAYDAGADAIWHVVINGEQAGPYTPMQLGEMLSAGHVDWEAYVWCEGLENWAPMRDLPDLVAAITGQGQEPAQQPIAERVSYASQPSMGADPFADDGGGGGLFDSPAAAPASRASLFGGGAAADSGGFGSSQVIASAPSPRVSAEQAMTGARNENSVLFSLKNLQALATGSSTTTTTPGLGASPAAGPGNRAGFAGGDGSGLIDIRALASATGVGEAKGEESEKDALLSIGSAQTGAFGALGSPMLAPVASDDGSSKKSLMIAVIAGFGLLAVAVVAVAFIMRPEPQVQTVVAPVAPPMAAAAAAVAPAPQPAAAAPEAAEPPSEGELAAKRNAAAASESDDEKRSRSSSSSSKRREEKADTSAPARSEPVAAAPKAEEKPKAKGGSSSIDDLLAGAISGGGGAKPTAKPAAAADPNLPDKPSRDQVLAAMNGVKSEVLACAKGQTGVAFADVTVSGKSGRVKSAEITGITGEAGSCIARAVRKASFPKFQSDTFQVKFHYRL